MPMLNICPPDRVGPGVVQHFRIRFPVLDLVASRPSASYGVAFICYDELGLVSEPWRLTITIRTPFVGRSGVISRVAQRKGIGGIRQRVVKPKALQGSDRVGNRDWVRPPRIFGRDVMPEVPARVRAAVGAVRVMLSGYTSLGGRLGSRVFVGGPCKKRLRFGVEVHVHADLADVRNPRTVRLRRHRVLERYQLF